MKIYLAGKISGDPDYQKKFNDIEAVVMVLPGMII